MSDVGDMAEHAASMTVNAGSSDSQPELYRNSGVAEIHDETNHFTVRVPVSGQQEDVNLQSATPGAENGNQHPRPRQQPKVFTAQTGEPKPSRPISMISRPTSVVGYSWAFPLAGIPEIEYPALEFFSAGFQYGLTNGVQIAENSASILKQLLARQNAYKLKGDPTADPEAATELIKDLKKASEFKFSSAKTIAFLGNSGEGKSSSINSLLDIPNLAAAADLGKACTSIVTEYRQRRLGQTERFMIEVEYLSDASIRDHIQELVWSFRRMILPDVAANLAWASLNTAFGHKKKFDREFLLNQSEGAFERITNLLYQWTASIPWPEGGKNGKWTAFAKTTDECYEMTRLFTHQMMWSFTKIIRVYTDAPILRTGYVITDLPGLQDTNLARVKAAQEYLTKCDYVFIVVRIQRAITDQSVKSCLHAAITQNDIDIENAERELIGPTMFSTKGLDLAIEEAKQRKRYDQQRDLEEQKTSLYIAARNNHVKEGLQAAYAEQFKGNSLNVFCISNSLYKKRLEVQSGSSPMLVNSSGIHELRRFFYSMAAEARFHDAKHFLRVSLPGILSAISLRCMHETLPEAKRSSDSLDVADILGFESKILLTIDNAKKEFDGMFRELILEFFDQRHAVWNEAAVTRGLKWAHWPLVEHTQLCLNYGKGISSTTGQQVNWNSEIVWKMRTELEFQWDLLVEGIPKLFANLSALNMINLRDLKLKLACNRFPYPMVHSIDYRIEEIMGFVEKSQEDLKSEIDAIRAKTMETNEASYVMREMIPVYRSGIKHDGSSLFKANSKVGQEVIQSVLESETLFPNIAKVVTEAAAASSQLVFKELRDTFARVWCHIMSDVHYVLVKNEMDIQNEERMKLEEKQYLAQLQEKLKRLETKYKVVLDSVKHYMESD
ncbi:hypothetical protein PENANT_c008G00195 [Penicillium antarcticum]|uniref:GED domain-containing protein n=1 Tax=Penicillium antarcticum TaxID=416450 RepID=A0A1V6QA97_9EURO|nr:hypothetical protein PENANT_c008G00195 [Penicillium antarcticum]